MKKDTSPEIQERYQAMIMALSPSERVSMCCGMFSIAKSLAEAGLKTEPNPGGLSMKARLFLRLYGNDFSREECDRIIQHLNGAEEE